MCFLFSVLIIFRAQLLEYIEYDPKLGVLIPSLYIGKLGDPFILLPDNNHSKTDKIHILDQLMNFLSYEV